MNIFSSNKPSQPGAILALEEFPGYRIARLQGPIDATSGNDIRQFQEKTRGLKNFQTKHLLLDFKEVTHIDTATIAGVIKTTAELKASHHKLGIINLDKKFYDMLEVLKADVEFFSYPNEEAAISDFTGKG